MSTPKNKKTSMWLECDSCGTMFFSKDTEKHSQDCPPNPTNISYNYLRNGTLESYLDVKKNEDHISSLSSKDLEVLVFLSQSVIQLCKLSIDDWALLKPENYPPVVLKVWPTVEKGVTSVLLNKNVFDLYFGNEKNDIRVSLSRLPNPILSARRIHLVILGNPGSIDYKHLIKGLSNSHEGRIFTVGNKITTFYYGKIIKFLIKLIDEEVGDFENQFSNLTVSNESFFKVNKKTDWCFYKSNDEYNKVINQNPSSEIGGLTEELTKLRNLMNSALDMNKKFNKLKLTNSILLYGYSGTGKTMLVNSLAHESKAHVVTLNAADLYSKYTSSPEETIKTLFNDAVENCPSIIVLDEVDLLCPMRSSRITETEKRIVSTLLVLLDELNSNLDAKVFIIATTNRIDTIDPCFRRCGRFEREMEIPIPNPQSRRAIIDKILNGISHDLTEEELVEVSSNTHGYVGADLVSLCRTAEDHANENNRNILKLDDFKFAIRMVRPSAMREVQIEVPNVKWADIGGQDSLKLILKQAVEWPLKHPNSFVRLGITPPKGVLMFGPPGCSKTMIAKALATESGLNFLSVKGPELLSKWVGESERAVREVFRKARQVAPSVIFFDEIDALGGERTSGSSSGVQERVLTQLLTELDGVTPLGEVTVLAATNRPDKIDEALLRPGRLDRIVYVPLPDDKTRREIFKLKLNKMPVVNVNVETLVSATERYSGAEINSVCEEAAMKALQENIDAESVTMEHFVEALGVVKPRTSQFSIQLCEDFVHKNK